MPLAAHLVCVLPPWKNVIKIKYSEKDTLKRRADTYKCLLIPVSICVFKSYTGYLLWPVHSRCLVHTRLLSPMALLLVVLFLRLFLPRPLSSALISRRHSLFKLPFFQVFPVFFLCINILCLLPMCFTECLHLRPISLLHISVFYLHREVLRSCKWGRDGPCIRT